MGIFDIFTGGSARDAAAQNAAAIAAAKKKSMGYLTTGLEQSTGAVNQGIGRFDDLSSKYGGATNMYLDALGVNGAPGTQRAQGAFTAGPGYQWMVDQATDAVNRSAGARGMLNSGNTMAAVTDRASGLAGQEYNNWLTNLARGIAPETAGVVGAGDMNKSLASLYQTDAQKRAGIEMDAAGGIANQNSMGANAAMQGSGNLWNFGLQGLKLATGLGGYGGFGGGQPAGYNWNGTGFMVSN